MTLAWNEIVKHYFNLWYENYVDAVMMEGESKEGQEFQLMPFEVLVSSSSHS